MKKMKKSLIISFILLLSITSLKASYILIPMDDSQAQHLKAYGLTYWVLQNDVEAWWLLNYRGGSFLYPHNMNIERESILRGITYQVIAGAQKNSIFNEISSPSVNMDAVKLETAPRIAVYTPPFSEPWDDAVTLALTYAEIPYDQLYDREIINGELANYDWLHLHHEDFTGQYGKFYAAYGQMAWYRDNQRRQEAEAKALGFEKVSHLKLAVVETIKAYVAQGGFMFAMCSATETFDIALAAAGVDICETMYDGDPADPNANEKLDFSRTLAFTDFTITMNPLKYEYSNIDATNTRTVTEREDYFTLFEFSAKWDPVPSMLTQNHTNVIKGFMGQTTSFNKEFVKPHVLIMGESRAHNEVRYIHGEHGKGFWTWYGGHDPEDYRHFVGDEPTELELHPNSPGYRLILNNVLFPAARKKKLKT